MDGHNARYKDKLISSTCCYSQRNSACRDLLRRKDSKSEEKARLDMPKDCTCRLSSKQTWERQASECYELSQSCLSSSQWLGLSGNAIPRSPARGMLAGL
jgi:hypothetical protein